MRSVAWAVVGGTILAVGIGWAVYFAQVFYPRAEYCPPGTPCASLLPLWDQPGLWIGIFTAVVGAVLVIVAIAKWLIARRHRAVQIEASKVVH
jgi:hypothetical protein